jgi:hypothetical protein
VAREGRHGRPALASITVQVLKAPLPPDVKKDRLSDGGTLKEADETREATILAFAHMQPFQSWFSETTVPPGVSWADILAAAAPGPNQNDIGSSPTATGIRGSRAASSGHDRPGRRHATEARRASRRPAPAAQHPVQRIGGRRRIVRSINSRSTGRRPPQPVDGVDVTMAPKEKKKKKEKEERKKNKRHQTQKQTRKETRRQPGKENENRTDREEIRKKRNNMKESKKKKQKKKREKERREEKKSRNQRKTKARSRTETQATNRPRLAL